MINPATLQKLRDMKFNAFATELERQYDDSNTYAALDFEDRLGLLIDAEWTRRQNNKLTRLINNAHFGDTTACVEDIEYIEDRHLNKKQILGLSTCKYIDNGRHIILSGASGNGKTYLACALGVEACRRFKSVKYIRMPELLEEFAIARANCEFNKVIKAYKKVDLLILDEWLIRKCTQQESYDLLELAEARSKKSMIFCTQYLVEGWYERINANPDYETPITESIIDRIKHYSENIMVDGQISMRERYGTRMREDYDA